MLTTVLAKKLDAFSNLDKAWCQTVIDHKYIIYGEGTKIAITDEDKSKYLYKLEQYLTEHYVPVTIHWIIFLINEFELLKDFTERNVICIPSVSQISELYRQYRTAAIVS